MPRPRGKHDIRPWTICYFIPPFTRFTWLTCFFDSSLVLSFMSEWGGSTRKSPTTAESPSPATSPAKQANLFVQQSAPTGASVSASQLESQSRTSPTAAQHHRSDSRPSSRPVSMIQTYQPPVMEVGQDTLPELQRIFTFLNSHSNKLYQEGYFLKFHDTDSRRL